MAAVPNALVVSWTDTKIRARCPYCLETHGHGFPLGPSRQRQSDCQNMIGGEYRLVFPQDNDPTAVGYGWEFDRTHSLFVTMNMAGRLIELNERPPYRSILPFFAHLHKPPELDEWWDEENEDEGLANVAKRLHLNDESSSKRPFPQRTWEALPEDPFESSNYRHLVYISACVQRNIKELHQLFEKYSDDDFVSQLNDDGDNGVLLAATEDNGVATVKWLQRRGAAMDQANHYGRTPLMEAALWGRLETVQYLTAHVQARDANGMNALELALNSSRNKGERVWRAGSVYREPVDADNQRARVESHLKRLSNNVLVHSSEAEDPSRRGLSFFQRTADGNLALYRPQTILLVPDGQPYKAFAELDRGPNYPLVTAMSGYTFPGWPNVLDNSLWANRADKLRRYLGLPSDIRAASHVEPQLLTYLVFQHTLVRFTDENEEFDPEDLQSLLDDLLPLNPDPIITVSKEDFCTSCQQFYATFTRTFPYLGVRFRFVGENLIQ